jgi:hypothetical protein
MSLSVVLPYQLHFVFIASFAHNKVNGTSEVPERAVQQ